MIPLLVTSSRRYALSVVKVCALVSLVAGYVAATQAEDCNENGIDDAIDIADGTSQDCNGNGVPDECDVAATLAFAGAQHLVVGERPVGAAIGDLNSDGLPDVAVANWQTHDVWVQINNGDGTFSAGGTVGVGPLPQAVVTAELNGDNNLDLVTANGSGGVSVLLGTGGGSFASAVNYAAGFTPVGVVAVDLDGVNGLDLAVVNRDSADVSVLLNNGDGTFGAAVDYAVGQQPSALAAADLDADGNADLAVTNEADQSVSVLRNNGDGTFAGQVVYALAAGQAPFAIKAADINGNGRLDLVVGASNGVVILRNAGLNGFAFDSTIAGNAVFYVTAADLDADGDVDIAATHLLGTDVSLLRNHGDGTFLAAVTVDAGSEPAGSAAGDLNGDGWPELVVANRGDDSVSILLNESLPAVSEDCNLNGRPDYCDANAWNGYDCNHNDVPDECEADCNGNRIADDCDLSSGASADCNGNGLPDACELTPIRYSWPVYYDLAPGDWFATAVTADFDGDGTVDVAASSGGGSSLSVYLNVGDGRLAAPVHHQTATWPGVVAAGDLNGDGAPDLIVCTGDGGGPVGVLLNNGDGTFPDQTTDYNSASRSHSVALADLDADGDLDAAVACYWLSSSQGLVGLLINNGDGLFTPASYSLGVGRAPISIAAGDLNGDTLPDLAVANSRDDTVSVLLNVGAAIFDPPADYAVGASPQHVAICDLEDDGDLDLVVCNSSDDEISLLLNDGSGTFGAPLNYPVGDNPHWSTSGDLDGDGLADLVIVNESSKDVSFLLNEGGAVFAPFGRTLIYKRWLGGGPPNSAALADLDGDTTLDLVVATSLAEMAVLFNESPAPTLPDCNRNGVPDECEPLTPGDYDGNGVADWPDFATLETVLAGPDKPLPPVACPALHLGAFDCDGDGDVDVADTAQFQAAFEASPR